MLKKLFVLLLIGLTQQGSAQTTDVKPEKKKKVRAGSWNIRIAGGYAWPGFIKSEGIMGPKIDPYTPASDALVPMANINKPNALDSSNSYQPVRGSYGRGWNFTFALGYNVNPYFGVELGVSYLKSDKITANQTYQLVYLDPNFPGFPPSQSPYYMKAQISTSAFGVSLMPSIYVKGAKPGWKLYPYARAGLSMPIYGGLTHDVKIDVQDEVFTESQYIAGVLDQSPYFLGNHNKIQLKTEGTVSLGVNGAIGLAYNVLPYMSITAEVNGQYLVTRAKSSKITQWDADGESKLAERGTYRTEFNFVDKLDQNSNNEDYNPNYNTSKPKDDIRPSGPFNNIGINIGLSFALSKETLKKNKAEK